MSEGAPVVAFLLPRDRNTGLNNVMQLLARNLDAEVVFCNSANRRAGIQTLRAYLRIRQLKLSGVIIHSSGAIPDLLNALSGRKRSSTTVHNYLTPDYVLQYGPFKGRLIAALHLLSLRRIGLVLGCSLAVTQNLRQQYGIASIPCVNGCADAPVRDDQMLPPRPRIFSFAGPYIRRKNVAPMVSALRAADPEAVIQLFGAGPEQAAIEAANAGAPGLQLGPVSEPMRHYTAGHFYISFSEYEGMPLSVLEATKCGLIPVLSAIPPHQELLELLGIEELHCFDSIEHGVRWALTLDTSQRTTLATALIRRSQVQFSEESFVSRFSACLLNYSKA